MQLLSVVEVVLTLVVVVGKYMQLIATSRRDRGRRLHEVASSRRILLHGDGAGTRLPLALNAMVGVM